MDARTEEIRAEWREAAKGIAEDAHCRYCDFQNQDSRLKCKRDVEFAAKEIVELVDSETAALREEVERLKMHMNAGHATEIADCKKALSALSAAGYCTPVDGYGSNSSWAISDLCRAVAALSPSPAQQETHGK